MAEEKKKKITGVNTIKKRLKTVLENQGSYTEGIDTLIETTSGILHSYYLVMREIESLSTPLLEEKTRENNIKTVANPLFKLQIDLAEMVRKQLRELRLTLATVEGVGDDEMDDLIDSVNSVE